MPPWVEKVVTALKDLAPLISLAAFVVAWLSFRRTSRLTSLQTRIADLELRNKERIEAVKDKAEIQAALFVDLHYSRIILENRGAAPASDVDIEFLDERGQGVLFERERHDKLPIPELDSGASLPLLIALTMGHWPPFKIALVWKDPDGTPHRRERMLHESA